MKLLGIRFCTVSEGAEDFAAFLETGLGLEKLKFDMPEGMSAEGFMGAVFPAGDSWIETWPVSDQMPPQTMLQLVVEDADALAEHARAQGVEVKGPFDAHGERIYMLTAPGGLPMSFQSKL